MKNGQKETRSLAQVAHEGEGAALRWAGKPEGKEGGKPPYGSMDKLRAEFEASQVAKEKGTVDISASLAAMARPVTERAKKNLEKRTLDEIFGSKEVQKKYLEQVKEAIEVLGEGDLHKFIVEHSTYEKGGYAQWNADLFKLLNFEPEFRGRDEAHTHRMTTAALQHFLVNDHPNDVFMLTQKKAHRFVYIDGRLGAYSVSVLADYWNRKFGKKSEKEPNPLGFSELDESYDESSKKLYENDKSYLAAQLGKAPAKEVTRAPSEVVKSTPLSPAEALAKKVKAQYKKLDKGGADVDIKLDSKTLSQDYPNLSSALADLYGEEIIKKETEKAPKTFRTLNLLAASIGSKINSIKLSEGDKLSISGDRLVIKSSNGSEISYELGEIKVEEVEKKKVAKKPRAKEEKLEATDKKTAEKTPKKKGVDTRGLEEAKKQMEPAIRAFALRNERTRDSGGREEIMEDLKELETDPTDWWNDVDDLSPAIAILVKQYQDAHKKWTHARSRKEGYTELEGPKKDAYKKLSRAVETFLKKEEAAHKEVVDNYTENLTALAANYEFESSVNVDRLTVSGADSVKRRILHEAEGRVPRDFLRRAQGFIKEGRMPRQTIKEKEELFGLVRGANEEKKKQNVNALWLLAAGSRAKRNPVDVINSWIYLSNY
ncbi:MAG: hypothetical protein OEY44_02210, partial [Candidatus Peregrinibacteria bacterium]|nr:hypothetical protein [Candidatus Peregrinibacteria bacterium]